MKAFTDVRQGEILKKILPLESADMHYNNVSIKGINYVDEYKAELMDYNTAQKVLSKYLVNPMFGIIPCWSLAALLSLLPRPTLHQTNDGKWYCDITDNRTYFSKHYDNPVDACVEMVLKLHE